MKESTQIDFIESLSEYLIDDQKNDPRIRKEIMNIIMDGSECIIPFDSSNLQFLRSPLSVPASNLGSSFLLAQLMMLSQEGQGAAPASK